MPDKITDQRADDGQGTVYGRTEVSPQKKPARRPLNLPDPAMVGWEMKRPGDSNGPIP